jgi:UDP-glucose:(heptosyl)LPS alpha-1,3-glucosyltransferase
MKIALTHLRHAKVGGTERFLNQISSKLADRGHDVTIICRTHEEPQHSGVKFISLRGMALGRGHRLWKFAKAVERHISNNHYDLVFGLGRTWSQDIVRVGGGLYRDQIKKGLGKNRYWPRDLIAEAIERKTFKKGNYKFVISNSYQCEKSLIEAYDIPPDRIRTIHNGVDIDRFNDNCRHSSGLALRRECGFNESNLVYIFLGNGFKRKGLDRLLDAFAKTQLMQPESRLLIVGHDKKQRDYEQHAQTLGIADKACFLGKRNNPELCFNAADVYVMPTRYDAFGYSALESLACGLPTIVTDSAGAAEVMDSTVSRVINSTDPELIDSLRDAMLELGNRPDKQMRAACKQAAAAHSQETSLNQYIQTLEAYGH